MNTVPGKFIITLLGICYYAVVHSQTFPSPTDYKQRIEHLSTQKRVDWLLNSTQIILRTDEKLGKQYLDFSLNYIRQTDDKVGLSMVLYLFIPWSVAPQTME